MKDKELVQILLAILVLALVIGFEKLVNLSFTGIGLSILFAFIIITINVLAKKITASRLDAGVEHEIWSASRYGFKPGWHLKNSVPLGVIIPLILTAFSLGLLKITTILTYETTALKRRAARRFGRTSYTEMTDWHIALVGASGIIAVLLVSFISYWIPSLELLSKFAAYYAFWNLLPISKLDGSQIFFGSRVLWTTLAVISAIFTAYALLII